VAEGEQSFSELMQTMRKTAAALREGDVPFMLGGGMAAAARGGPESDHDVDFLLTERDAERALDVLENAGFRPERPPENWLYKVWDDGVFVDLIFTTSAGPVTEEMFERSDELEVYAVRMNVLSLEDVLVTKLMALKEQEDLDYKGSLEIARSLRERIDWDAVRERTAESPYARAFLFLAEELGIVERP
jgi:predicted nucleotidyltransferase